MRSSLPVLSRTDVGEILNLFSQDMNIIDTQLPRLVNNMCLCLVLAVAGPLIPHLRPGPLGLAIYLHAEL